MYKSKQYRVRSLEEIREDIAHARKRYGQVDKIFLADGDALAMETEDLLAVLAELRKAFGAVRQISLYAGPKNILTKSDEDLVRIREAGVSLAYFGIESGDGQVLKEVKKGATPDEVAIAGKKIQRAGIELSATVILGLAGGARWREHALATAEVVNAVNPKYLAALTLMADSPAELPSARESLIELKLFLENLDVRSVFRSNHASNYFAVAGTLPGDRDAMMRALERALGDARLLKDEGLRGL
jgi:radical SAM superfamily enzyme YgiQ (UPF0313 family)